MAAVTRPGDDAVAPVEVIMTTKTYREAPLLVEVHRGQELKLTNTGWRLREAGERADGMAMKYGVAGARGFDILVIGEMDGYTGLTTGARLYPDAAANGELNTTAVVGFNAMVKVLRPSRIQVNYAGG